MIYWGGGQTPNQNKASISISANGTYDAGQYNTIYGSTTLDVGTWYHIAGVFKPSTYLRLYVNGVLDAEQTTGVLSSLYTETSLPVRIGVTFDPSLSARFFLLALLMKFVFGVLLELSKRSKTI